LYPNEKFTQIVNIVLKRHVKGANILQNMNCISWQSEPISPAMLQQKATE